MTLIALILAACLAALVYGWLHSARTRRLAIAALIIVAALIILTAVWAFIVKTWFPVGRPARLQLSRGSSLLKSLVSRSG